MSQHIYTYDASQDQLNEIGGAGHIIKDAAGTSYTKRENLQFVGTTVTDDSTNNTTIVSVDETNFVGTLAQWNALTLAQKAKYKTVDLTDDFNGDPIDATPTANSQHAVQSGGVYTALATKADAADVTSINEALTNIDSVISTNGAKNLLPNEGSTQVINGVTFTVNSDGTISVSGTASATTLFTFTTFYPNTKEISDSNSLKVSGCPSGGSHVSGYSFGVSISKRSTNQWIRDVFEDGDGADVSLGADEFVKTAYIYIFNGTVISTPITFKPMITLADQPDSDYAHYVPYAMTNKELTDLHTRKRILVSTSPSFEIYKEHGMGHVYSYLSNLDSDASVTIGTFTDEFKPYHSYAILPLYSSGAPYVPVGSVWLSKANKTVMVYKPSNITAGYVFGNYLLNEP